MTYNEKKCMATEMATIRDIFGPDSKLFDSSLEELMNSYYCSAANSTEEWVELMVEKERYALIISPLSEDEIVDRIMELIGRLDEAGYWEDEEL